MGYQVLRVININNTYTLLPLRRQVVGRHCCLWCLITSDGLKDPNSFIEERTVESILTDHRKFLAQGGGGLEKS